MRAYGDGDAGAFEALYARHRAATYRYFLRHSGSDAATAEELHQDLWLRVIGARRRYEAQAKFSTWLYTLARHRMVDHWRARQGVTLASLEDEETAAQVDASSDRLASPATIRSARRSTRRPGSGWSRRWPACRRCSGMRSCCISRRACRWSRYPASRPRRSRR